MDKNSITLYENKEFLHPIINYQTKIEAELSMNVYHEEILFITNYEPSEVEFNNQRNSQLTYQKKFTYYSETTDLIISIIFTKPNFVASLKYGIIEKVPKFYSTFFDTKIVHLKIEDESLKDKYFYLIFKASSELLDVKPDDNDYEEYEKDSRKDIFKYLMKDTYCIKSFTLDPHTVLFLDIYYETDELSSLTIFFIVVGSIIGAIILGVLFLICFCDYCRPLMKRIAQEKREKELQKKLRRAEDLYELIKSNYRILDETCLFCVMNNKIIDTNLKTNEKQENLIELNDDLNQGNDIVIEDINSGKFDNIIKYITPTKCDHFFHEKCYQKNGKCCFCKSYITVENMNKFGIFFTKENFRDLVDFFITENDRMEMYELRQNIITS